MEQDSEVLEKINKITIKNIISVLNRNNINCDSKILLSLCNKFKKLFSVNILENYNYNPTEIDNETSEIILSVYNLNL